MEFIKADRERRPASALLATTALGLVFFPLTATAQAQDSEPVAVGEVSIEAEAPDYKAEPVSPKYTAPLIDTPRSITVVTDKVLEDTAATTLVDALRTVPGITMAMGEGGQPFADRPFIRGAESTSGIMVDGVRDASAQSRDVFNLEQIEVSRGANGTMAGRGAAGGSLNLITKTAKAEDFIAGSIALGNADHKRATLDVNEALSENVGVRVNGMWQESEIPGRDGVYDNRWGFAPTITWGLNSPDRATLSYSHYESDGIIDYGHPLDTTTGQPVKGIDPDNFYGLLNRDFHDTLTDSAQLELSHELNSFMTLRNITRIGRSENAYIATNPDDSQGNVVNGLVFRNTKSNNSKTDSIVNQTDVQAFFDAGGVSHSISAGLELGHEKTERATYSVTYLAPGDETIPRGGCDLFGAGAASGYNCTDLYNPNPNDPWSGTITLNDPTKTQVDTAGIYLFDSITLNDQFIVNLGVRGDDFSTKTSTDLSNHEFIFSYQAGLIYKPTYNTSLYASYGTSASPSGLTAGDGSDNLSVTEQDLKPEKNRNVEVGVKWEPEGRDLALNAAIFRNEIVDGHVSVEAGRGGAQQAIGEQRVQGVELSATGSITPQWDVFAGYSYMDSEIIDAGPINVDTVGNKLPNTPEHSVSLWTTYDILPKLSVGGGATYMSERFGDTSNTKSVDSYWKYDAMVSYAITQNIDFQLNANNLTDERYYDRVYTTHMATIAPGRSIIGSLKFKY
ncbi:TonB-dependent siderophore receptor [Hyphomonas chukchiensis]|uniref:TonB-dependent receptor n=1 Tax=Hyphomonas chukchiensis TaxID=1280947 RepID=UPI0030FAD352